MEEIVRKEEKQESGIIKSAWEDITTVVAFLLAFWLAGLAACSLINATFGTISAEQAILYIPILIGSAAGLALYFQSTLYEKKLAQDLELEKRILLFASRQNGRSIGVAEVALHCNLLLKSSEEALNKMSSSGVCKVTVGPDGLIVYSFSGLKLAMECRNSERLKDED